MGDTLSTPEPPPSPPTQPFLDSEWRKVDWNNKDTLLNRVKEYQPQNTSIKHVRILLHGPVGAGKSSFINSVNSIFQERMTHDAHADQKGAGASYTKKKQTHKIQKGNPQNFYPFVFNDIIGLEKDGLDKDITFALEGCVKDGYKFNPRSAIDKKDPLYYNKDPTPDDTTHVLVCVIPADIATILNEKLLERIRNIRLEASELDIPQICIFTKIDKADPLMEEDVKNVYRMKIVKKKMQEFSDTVGIPMNCIFPVKNYHEEDALDNDIDVLILKALLQMIDLGEDFINKNMPHFYIVEFTDERTADGVTIDIVPACWLIDEAKEECWWPRKNASAKVPKAMQEDVKTDGTWQRCPVHIMRSAGTYSEARKKLSDAEKEADRTTTESDTPKKRKRTPSSKVTHQSSEDESDSCGEDDLPPNPPHGLTPSVHQRARHPAVPSSASRKERHHHGLQSPISVRESPSMRRSSESQSPSSASESRVRHSSGSQSPSSASESRVRSSSGSQGPTCPNCVGPTVYRNLVEFMEKQAEDIRVIKSMLNLVLKQQALPLAVSLLEPPAGADFPLKTNVDVDSMNEKLSDPAFMSGVVAMVADIGGTSLDDATRRMMQYLLSHDLAVQFNLYGRHNKRKFREMRLYDVIYGGLKKNALTQETNHKDAEKALSKWFCGARDRGGRRARPQTQLPQLDDAPPQ